MEDSISLINVPLATIETAAFELLKKVVPSDSGSKAFGAIVQGRSVQAEQAHQLLSTCGFLPNFVWFRLGCRNHLYLNWDDPLTTSDEYAVGRNISKIYYGGLRGGLFLPYTEGMPIRTGDTVYIDNDSMTNAHVFMYVGDTFNDANELCWHTAEAGQVNAAGRQCARFKKRTVKNGRVEDGRRVMGIFPLSHVHLTEDADLSAP